MTVGEVMVTDPQTVPADALVADVRRAFEKPSQRTVLIAQDGIFLGTIERESLPVDAAGSERALPYAAREVPTATPQMPMSDAVALLDGRPEPRLVVLEEGGAHLSGLLCYNRGDEGFCVR